jgi:four helix bundle protein
MSESRINSYKDLIVWQKSYELVKEVYRETAKLPKEEVFSLQSQARRCAVSIVSNIAEGSNRKTKKDYVHFLHVELF